MFEFIIAVFIITVVGAVLINVFSSKAQNERREEQISSLSGQVSREYEYCGLVIDKTRKKWSVASGNKGATPHVYNFSDLLDYKLVENGIEYKASGGVMRAVTGGALFGSVGAVVGASTATRKQQITTLYVLITTSDFANPVEKIVLWDSPQSPASGTLYNDLIEKANKITGMLAAIKAYS